MSEEEMWKPNGESMEKEKCEGGIIIIIMVKASCQAWVQCHGQPEMEMEIVKMMMMMVNDEEWNYYYVGGDEKRKACRAKLNQHPLASGNK